MTTTVAEPLTLEGLANLLGRSADWWARKARKKEIPHFRVGKTIMFTADHVAQIIAANEVQPKTGPTKPPAPAPAPSAPMGLTPRSAAAARRRAGKAVA